MATAVLGPKDTLGGEAALVLMRDSLVRVRQFVALLRAIFRRVLWAEYDRFGSGGDALPGTPGRRPTAIGKTLDALRLPDGNIPRGAPLIFMVGISKTKGCRTPAKRKIFYECVAVMNRCLPFDQVVGPCLPPRRRRPFSRFVKALGPLRLLHGDHPLGAGAAEPEGVIAPCGRFEI